MINVLASIRVKPGKRAAFLEAFQSQVPQVRQEPGCIEYFPAVDLETPLAMQQRDENLITIIEKWQSLEALRTHLGTPRMDAYREQVKELVEEVTLKVLQQA